MYETISVMPLGTSWGTHWNLMETWWNNLGIQWELIGHTHPPWPQTPKKKLSSFECLLSESSHWLYENLCDIGSKSGSLRAATLRHVTHGLQLYYKKNLIWLRPPSPVRPTSLNQHRRWWWWYLDVSEWGLLVAILRPQKIVRFEFRDHELV